MKLLSVNVAQPQLLLAGSEMVSTGIFKQPVAGRVRLSRLNLEGDAQADLRVHGGPHKAVYAYSIENYEYWKERRTGEEFPSGQFGENFTVEGMTEDRVRIGDQFRIGTAVVEVTQPRVPCFKLALKMGDPQFPKHFLRSERVGFYLRVLEEGEVGAGDAIELVSAGPEQMSVKEIVHLLYFDKKDRKGAQRALRIPALSPGWRESFEEILAKAGDDATTAEALRER